MLRHELQDRLQGTGGRAASMGLMGEAGPEAVLPLLYRVRS